MLKLIATSLIALPLIIGCDDVKNLQTTRYANYPKLCKDYYQQYDGMFIRGRGGKLNQLDTIMEYCKYTETHKEKQ